MDKIQAASPQWQTQAAAPQKSTEKQATTSTPDFMKSLESNDTFTLDQFSQPKLNQGMAEQALSLDLDIEKDYQQMQTKFSPQEQADFSKKFERQAKYVTKNVGDDKIGFFNNHLSTDKALFELQARRPNPEDFSFSRNEQHGFQDGRPVNDNQRAPKLRSPLLKDMARTAAEDFIRNPLEAAFDSGEMSGGTLRAAGLASALIAGAVLAPTDIKTNTRLFKTSFSDYEVAGKVGISSGHGDVGFRSIGFSVRPPDQSAKERSSIDLKYDMEDKQVGLSYSKSIHYGGFGAYSSNSYFNAGVSHSDKTDETKASISYHRRF